MLWFASCFQRSIAGFIEVCWMNQAISCEAVSALFLSELTVLQWICLIPITVGAIYNVVCVICVLITWAQSLRPRTTPISSWPAVTVLKPVFGLEKGLMENVRSTCLQDYPDFQVVVCVQRVNDPAIPLLDELQREFGREKLIVAIEQCTVGPNGKINNLVGGLKHARHDFLVVSDSDIRLRPDYLKTIIAPLSDPEVGYVSTLFKAIEAHTHAETMELLTINADIVPNMAFAVVSGAAKFCLGASVALRRSTLDAIGGFASLANYLVEDYEMSKRIVAMGKHVVMVPYHVETPVDIQTLRAWWDHLVRCEQSYLAARPGAMFSTIVIRPVPFAVLFALSTWGSFLGFVVLTSVIAIRLVSAGIMMRWWLHDSKGVRSLWLLPLRDVVTVGSWVCALTTRTTIWRGTTFVVSNGGRLTLASNVVSDNELPREGGVAHQAH
jgi:ceramide glucosyltransferase